MFNQFKKIRENKGTEYKFHCVEKKTLKEIGKSQAIRKKKSILMVNGNTDQQSTCNCYRIYF